MQIAQSIGEDQFSRYQKMFGFGEYTDIDLPGEIDTSGLLYEPENMDPASLATNSFGQNFNVTMTQMAAAFCSLVNGGDYYRPHIMKEVQDENGNVVETNDSTVVRRTVSEETCEKVKDYMWGVVQEGTGTNAAVEGYDIGGKTGTAEKLPRGNNKYLISFIGFAPVENPEIVVYVVIDEPNAASQEDTSLVTGLAADIMKEIFPYLGITQNGTATSDSTDASAADTSTDSTADSTTDTTTSYDTGYTDGSYTYDTSGTYSYDNSGSYTYDSSGNYTYDSSGTYGYDSSGTYGYDSGGTYGY